ncbi:hypothetical protein G7Z17_g6752 [Cylindrodendrum hubeiense]|uniref:Uncharacterized protein n=1 Tax=Cylindrodendrum hubeiense TaxID=595255 RepID=A0A9P5LG07_9HYPO|nr:hypothetical protein G7Z17_g6752 [Cylindrodendrum hubeiense]
MTLVAKAGSAVVLLISLPAPKAPQVAKSGADQRHAPEKLGAILEEDPAGDWARPRRASEQQAASNQAVLYLYCTKYELRRAGQARVCSGGGEGVRQLQKGGGIKPVLYYGAITEHTRRMSKAQTSDSNNKNKRASYRLWSSTWVVCVCVGARELLLRPKRPPTGWQNKMGPPGTETRTPMIGKAPQANAKPSRAQRQREGGRSLDPMDVIAPSLPRSLVLNGKKQ